MDNTKCAVLTKEVLEQAIADLKDDTKWRKQLQEGAKQERINSDIMSRCFAILDNDDAPNDVKSAAAYLINSTAFNGFPVCSKEAKEKLEGWI